MNKKFWILSFAIVGLPIAVYTGCGSSLSPSDQRFLVEGSSKAYTISDLLVLEQEGLISDGTLLSEYVPAPTGSEIYADTPPTPDPTPPPQPTNPPPGGTPAPSGGIDCGPHPTWGCIKAKYRSVDSGDILQ